MMHKKIQSGRSMVEMLGVLAIIGVLSIGGIAGYAMAMEKYKINQTLESIQLVVQEVRTMFENEINFDGLGYSDDVGSVASVILEKVSSNNSYELYLYDRGDGFSLSVRRLDYSSCRSIGGQAWSQYGKILNQKIINAGYGGVNMADAIAGCEDVSNNFVELFFNKYGIEDFYAGEPQT